MSKMTNLKAGSGPTREPVPGPHSRLIFRLARWPSNWLLGGPRTVTQKGSILQKEAFCFLGPELAFWDGVRWTRQRLSSMHIYIYIAIYIYTYIYIYIHISVVSLRAETLLQDFYAITGVSEVCWCYLASRELFGPESRYTLGELGSYILRDIPEPNN